MTFQYLISRLPWSGKPTRSSLILVKTSRKMKEKSLKIIITHKLKSFTVVCINIVANLIIYESFPITHQENAYQWKFSHFGLTIHKSILITSCETHKLICHWQLLCCRLETFRTFCGDFKSRRVDNFLSKTRQIWICKSEEKN